MMVFIYVDGLSKQYTICKHNHFAVPRILRNVGINHLLIILPNH